MHRQLPTQWELENCAMTFFSIILIACFHSEGVVAGMKAKVDIHIWIICFPVSVHGCQLRENMDISGTSVQTWYVKSTEECAKICSQMPACDSFWCFTSGGLEKSCHLKRNGKLRKADHKTAGICSKGRFSYFGDPLKLSQTQIQDRDILQIIPAVGWHPKLEDPHKLWALWRIVTNSRNPILEF